MPPNQCEKYIRRSSVPCMVIGSMYENATNVYEEIWRRIFCFHVSSPTSNIQTGEVDFGRFGEICISEHRGGILIRTQGGILGRLMIRRVTWSWRWLSIKSQVVRRIACKNFRPALTHPPLYRTKNEKRDKHVAYFFKSVHA